jgi:Domain of unknown function (DUF5916)
MPLVSNLIEISWILNPHRHLCVEFNNVTQNKFMHLAKARTGLVLLLLIVVCHAQFSFAQDTLRIIKATRISGKIKIDGKLNDLSWSEVEPFVGNFYQLTPDNGAESTYQSKIYLAYDNKAIYVGALFYDPDPQSIPQELGIRDAGNLNVDQFALIIDPLNKGLNGFVYSLTAAGVQGDAIITSTNIDNNWNTVWNSAVTITDEGWIAEMEIPYSAIRFPAVEKPVWGINFFRSSKRLNEETTWNFIDQEEQGFLNQSGELHGLKDIKPPLRLSFLPYFSVGAGYSNRTKSFTRSFAGGMDMKLGLSESFTLDMSLVPDFSQVASDNVVLNLSPFEVRYDERRPFFTEGVELFSKGRIFYSRRIGQMRGYVDPNDLSPAESVVNMPLATQLINATKISGRTGGGTGIGLFNALTANTYARLEDEEGRSRNYLVEPVTNFNVFVVDQNLKNNSYIGLINTNVIRQGDYRDANVTLADFRFRDKTNTWSLSGSGGLSQIFRKEEGFATNTRGFRTRLFFSKVSGKFQFSTGAMVDSDNWDINDLGFMRRSNRVLYTNRVSYNIFKPFSVFNNMSARFSVNYEQLYKPRNYVGTEFSVNWNAQFRNFYNVGFGVDLRPYDNYDYFEPREPGYFFKTNSNYNLYAYLASDRRKKINMGVNAGMWHRKEDKANVYWGGISPSYRMSNRMSLDYNLNVSVARDTKGFVTKKYDSLNNLTSIIFGHRNQNTITNILGLKYTFTDKMGLNFRMRHYWSWVEYDKFYNLTKEGSLVDSDHSGLDGNGMPIHNTTFNAFNIDMVYSWEVAPGSFFTAIWKSQVYANSDVAQKDFFDNLAKTFDQNGANSLTLKLVYYIDIAYFRKNKA